MARVYDLNTLQCQSAFEGGNSPLMSLAWSADDRYLATGSSDGQLRIYSVKNGELLHTSQSAGSIFSISIGSNNSIICATSSGQVIYHQS